MKIRFGWLFAVLTLLLAACASTMLLAVTNHLTQNVTSIPFLWILPLTLYLATFIFCFDNPRWYQRNAFLVLAAVMAAIGMFSGYCGTLMTPMAANYNIVPAALLELSNKNAVIRAQVMTALPLMACNLILMYWFIFLVIYLVINPLWKCIIIKEMKNNLINLNGTVIPFAE